MVSSLAAKSSQMEGPLPPSEGAPCECIVCCSCQTCGERFPGISDVLQLQSCCSRALLSGAPLAHTLLRQRQCHHDDCCALRIPTLQTEQRLATMLRPYRKISLLNGYLVAKSASVVSATPGQGGSQCQAETSGPHLILESRCTDS